MTVFQRRKIVVRCDQVVRQNPFPCASKAVGVCLHGWEMKASLLWLQGKRAGLVALMRALEPCDAWR